jgi:hypothetical protein
MNAKDRVRWLNARDPLHKWSVGQDVYCLHCEAVFKAEDVGEDFDNLPECPLCKATPLDFFTEPFWREDLIDQKVVGDRFVNTWRVPPICAVPGQPRVLPPQPNYSSN